MQKFKIKLQVLYFPRWCVSKQQNAPVISSKPFSEGILPSTFGSSHHMSTEFAKGRAPATTPPLSTPPSKTFLSHPINCSDSLKSNVASKTEYLSQSLHHNTFQSSLPEECTSSDSFASSLLPFVLHRSCAGNQAYDSALRSPNISVD